MNLQAIKPDDTGKYSPLLYKFLTSLKAKKFGYNRIYKCGSVQNRSVRYDKLLMNKVIIGSEISDGCVSGRTLGSILRGARGDATQVFCFSVEGYNMLDITEHFFAEYERIGRCIWDQDHTNYMVDSDKRFTMLSEIERLCNWCGKHFVGERKEYIKVTPYIDWKEIK